MVLLATGSFEATATASSASDRQVAYVAESVGLPVVDAMYELFSIGALAAGLRLNVVRAWVLFLGVEALHQTLVEGEGDIISV